MKVLGPAFVDCRAWRKIEKALRTNFARWCEPGAGQSEEGKSQIAIREDKGKYNAVRLEA
jgi:hypothetical protein